MLYLSAVVVFILAKEEVIQYHKLHCCKFTLNSLLRNDENIISNIFVTSVGFENYFGNGIQDISK